MNDKVAIVTGAGQGIGYAIVRELLARGARVLLNDRDEALAADAVKRLIAEVAQMDGGASPGAPENECVAFAGDAGDVGFVRRMVQEAGRVFGRLDIVIAN